jgi:hypothetical protein
MKNWRIIKGAWEGKGGGGGSQSIKEDADTLRSKSYARFIDLVSEGEIEGFVDRDGNVLSNAVAEVALASDPGPIASVKLVAETGKGYFVKDGSGYKSVLECTVNANNYGGGAAVNLVVCTEAGMYLDQDGNSKFFLPGEAIKFEFAKDANGVEQKGSGYKLGYVRVVPPSVVGRGIYFDDVPLMSSEGNYNFKDVTLVYTSGTQNQQPLSGFEITESIVAQPSTEIIYNETPYSFSFSGDYQSLTIGIRFGALMTQVLSGGDIGHITATEVSFQVEYQYSKDNGAFSSWKKWGGNVASGQPGLYTVKGKTGSPYVYSIKNDLERDPNAQIHSWIFRISKLTPPPATANSMLRNDMYLDYASAAQFEVYSYPNSALIGVAINAEQFRQIPERAYHLRLLKIKVPVNYFPGGSFKTVWSEKKGHYERVKRVTGEYTRNSINGSELSEEQIWDGRFYTTWCNNPAWVFYDFLVNERYGLGKHVVGVDKWTLYSIAKYCDELVDSGFRDENGEMIKEPRFTCNLYLQTREEAAKVMNDLASIFRGIIYWANGTIMAVQDSPKKTLYQFTSANVKDGIFTYSGTASKARHTVALVRYNDPYNDYRAAMEYVEDLEGILRYGVRELEIAAMGCTSRGQANRLGKHALLTERCETDALVFRTGLEGSYLRPGDVISVNDPARSGVQFGGRIKAIESLLIGGANYQIVVLDRWIEAADRPLTVDGQPVTYYAVLINPKTYLVPEELDQLFEAKTVSTPQEAQEKIDQLRETMLKEFEVKAFEERTIQPGTKILALKFSAVLPASIQEGSIWGLRSNRVEPQYFRVIGIEEIAKAEFEVTAIEYQESKYDEIEKGLEFTEKPISQSLVTWKRPDPVTNLVIQTVQKVINAKDMFQLVASWTPPEEGYPGKYLVYLRKNIDETTYGTYSLLGTSETTAIEALLSVAGWYSVKVVVEGLGGSLSVPVETTFEVLTAASLITEVVTGLEIQGQGNDNEFLTAGVTLDWRKNSRSNRYELGSEPDDLGAEADDQSSDLSHYEIKVLKSDGTELLRARTQESHYHLGIDQNKALSGGPYRNFKFEVVAKTKRGGVSLPSVLTISNPNDA